MDVIEEAQQLARAIFERLDQKGEIVVFAESCTGGLVAALLAANPGASRCLAGSWVTYQDSAKIGWLGVDPSLVGEKSGVSAEVTQAMARGALERTPDAGLSFAVTGHLEPENPLDGPFAYVSACFRNGGHVVCISPQWFRLNGSSRVERQYKAACHVLSTVRNFIETSSG